MISIKKFLQRLRPEDPRRINAFRDKLDALKWDKQNVVESLSGLFAAVDNLAEAEVNYYYRRRGTRALISGLSRFTAWLLGSIGLLLPLLPDVQMFKDWEQYGYVFLAGAASCLAANSLFGGTDGHIRFVSMQLKLEKLITASRVNWCKYLASTHETDAEIAEGFSLILAYADSLHTATISETGRWGETLLTELAKYQSSIDARGSAQGK